MKDAAAAFARKYGSSDRVLWFKAQPCVVCFKLPSDNAHVRTGGTGRKGGFHEIIPLCRRCHWTYTTRALAAKLAHMGTLLQIAAWYHELWLRVGQREEPSF